MVFDNMCHTHWSSVAEYNSAASSLGAGGAYAGVSAFLNLNSNDVTNTLNQIYDHLCITKDVALRDHLFSQSHVQISNVAVDAWKACVLHSTGLYSALELPPDGDQFTIHVHFQGATAQDKLMLKGYRSDAGFNCKLGDYDISDFTPKDHGIGDDFALSCQKTSKQSAQVAISTNTLASSIGPFTVQSRDYFDLTQQVSSLQRAIADLTMRLQAVDGELKAKTAQVKDELYGWSTKEIRNPTDQATGADGDLYCKKGFYVAGLRLARTNGLFNGLQLICQNLNADTAK